MRSIYERLNDSADAEQKEPLIRTTIGTNNERTTIVNPFNKECAKKAAFWGIPFLFSLIMTVTSYHHFAENCAENADCISPEWGAFGYGVLGLALSLATAKIIEECQQHAEMLRQASENREFDEYTPLRGLIEAEEAANRNKILEEKQSNGYSVAKLIAKFDCRKKEEKVEMREIYLDLDDTDLTNRV